MIVFEGLKKVNSQSYLSRLKGMAGEQLEDRITHGKGVVPWPNSKTM